MSAFLTEPARPLDLTVEYGCTTRIFSRLPYVVRSGSYVSSLFFVYRQTAPLGHRVYPYRNHYALYTNATTVLICRAETTIDYNGANDAVLVYDIIRPVADASQRYRTTVDTDAGGWAVSFDSIHHSTDTTGIDWDDYTLQCAGEWWYFDNGVVLSGLSAYRPAEMCHSVLVYYELHTHFHLLGPNCDRGEGPSATTILVSNRPIVPHPPMPLPPSQSTPPVAAAMPPVANVTCIPRPDVCHHSGDQCCFQCWRPNAMAPHAPIQFRQSAAAVLPLMAQPPQSVAGIVPPAALAQLEALATPLIYSNDRPQPGRPAASNPAAGRFIKAALPTAFWFHERARELACGDIAYFLPQNYTAANGNR